MGPVLYVYIAGDAADPTNLRPLLLPLSSHEVTVILGENVAKIVKNSFLALRLEIKSISGATFHTICSKKCGDSESLNKYVDLLWINVENNRSRVRISSPTLFFQFFLNFWLKC